jgi:hypothetical protein
MLRQYKFLFGATWDQQGNYFLSAAATDFAFDQNDAPQTLPFRGGLGAQ